MAKIKRWNGSDWVSADGYGNSPSGPNAHAEGMYTTSSGNASHSEGGSTTASGDFSHAEGTDTLASGQQSHAEGDSTKAEGYSAHAEGTSTTAKGSSSHAEGSMTVSKTDYTHSEGKFTFAGEGTPFRIVAFDDVLKTITINEDFNNSTSISVGTLLNIQVDEGAFIQDIPVTAKNGYVITLNTTKTITSDWRFAIKADGGTPTHAEGYCTAAIGLWGSHAEGEDTLASGSSSHAEGLKSLAQGDYSHAEGNETTSSGISSHAEGDTTIASGSSSHAEGNRTVASGNDSHAEGYSTIAGYDNAHAEGGYTLAATTNSHAEGNISIACHGKVYNITAYNDSQKTITLDSVTGLSPGDYITVRVDGSRPLHDIYIWAINGLTVNLTTTQTINSSWKQVIGKSSTQYPNHAEGYNTLSSGAYAHAEGDRTTASGDSSHSQNKGTTAQGQSQTAIGEFNVIQGNISSRANTDYAFIIGNGTSDVSRSNALTVNWQGDVSAAGKIYSNGVDISTKDTINVETLSADKTLVSTDAKYQYLNPNGATRIITLPASGMYAGQSYTIRNNGTNSNTYNLDIRQSGVTLDNIYAGAIKTFVYDGTNWVSAENGSGENDIKKYNVTLGSHSKAYNAGTAIGYTTTAYSYGVAVGNAATGNTYGVALGPYSNGASYGIALGNYAHTNSKYSAVAKGYYSKAERYNEEWKCSDSASTNKYGYGQLNWCGETTTATPTEIFLGGTASNRATLLTMSAFMFKLYVVAYANGSTEGSTWEIKGGIRRDGGTNTALIGTVSKTQISKDAGVTTWDVTVSADDVNEALKITVTGEASHTIRWNVTGIISECRF